MNSGQPDISLSAGSQLGQVLELAEDLLSLAQHSSAAGIPPEETLQALRRRIEAAVERVVGGRANVWFSSRFIRLWTNNPIENRPGASVYDRPTALMRRCMEARRTCYLSSNPAAHDEPTESIHFIDPGGSGRMQALAAPLMIRSRQGAAELLLGVVQVGPSEPKAFTLEDAALLEAFAIQSALVLQSGLQIVIEDWRLKQLALVRQVSLEIADLRNLDEMARRVTRLIQQTFEYYCVTIFTLEPDQATLQFRATAGVSRPDGGESGLPALAVRLGEGIIGYVAQSGEEVISADVSAEPRYHRLDALPETRSEVALPLRMHHRLLGVLDVQSNQADDFNETDLLVLRSLAVNIAIAIEDARLYTGLKQRASQLEMLYQVSSAITSVLDQDRLLEKVAELIGERFGYPFVHLYTVHPGRRKIFYEAGSGLRDPALREQSFAYDLDDPQGMIPWVARHAETLLANDVSQEPRYRPSPLPPEETRSELTVPLIFGGQVLGILDVQSDRLNAFLPEDRFLFEALADHVAIALRNSALYRSEVWRRRLADSLREVAGLLSADVGLDQVLQAILAVLGRTLPQNLAAIWLIDATVEEEGEGLPPLHLAAVQGNRGADLIGADNLSLEVGLTPEEVLEYNQVDGALLSVDDASGWLQAALTGTSPVVRAPGSGYEPLGAALGFPADYSAIAAPLRVGDQTLGVLVLAHRTSGRYGSEASGMTAAFASSAAVAIENARLYEAAHEQAWVSTVLLQVANATQTMTELNELLATVIHITPMLAGVKACLLYILDDDGDFVPAAASGLSSQAQTEFERWRFAPGDVTALDRLIEEKAPVFLHGGQDDRRLTSILSPVGSDAAAVENTLPSDESAASDNDLRLTVLVPMLARGQVIGTFLVDYSAAPAALTGRSLEAFFDERLAILQGIAHQTAIAVDNIHLLKSQKEETYISVALLQVAQAVVSSNDLNEALGSIVRITPILVGVKRAMIFLWDEVHNVFRLSQSYGIAHVGSADGSSGPLALQYALGDFPLLDAVLVENDVLAHPLWSELSVSEDVPEEWTYLAAPDLDKVDEYLANAACLLLAFPLSVKGKVLGVFLVEEPELTPGEGLTGANANRRLRGKRLEIITGISQQAALAIENDLLQSETLERERLEREMQLAREIQRAFLPQSVPEIPGWDLKIRWRTAREVGGDFYDFFPLPGNRMGLVIADVADKGMPAALFMTLVRTLLRATVRERDSPADVLERANDLMVPDAPRGMFVTIFYAVLDLDTGVLEYANAGHNQPLLLRSGTCAIELLARGGMALGVQEGNKIVEGQTNLSAGDFLVLYTDGVTEAFSPTFEPFGEERLHRTIAAAAGCLAGQRMGVPGSDDESIVEQITAQDMVARIDRAVLDFIAGGLPSDDLTLVVLKREPPENEA